MSIIYPNKKQIKKYMKESVLIEEPPLIYALAPVKGNVNAVHGKKKISSARDLHEYMTRVYDLFPEHNTQEIFFAIYMNRSNTVIACHHISTGGMSGTIVDMKVLLHGAVLCGASAVALCHNHPSKQKFPSSQDKDITEKAKNAMRNMDINLLDHIIYCDRENYYSFADEGMV